MHTRLWVTAGTSPPTANRAPALARNCVYKQPNPASTEGTTGVHLDQAHPDPGSWITYYCQTTWLPAAAAAGCGCGDEAMLGGSRAGGGRETSADEAACALMAAVVAADRGRGPWPGTYDASVSTSKA